MVLHLGGCGRVGHRRNTTQKKKGEGREHCAPRPLPHFFLPPHTQAHTPNARRTRQTHTERKQATSTHTHEQTHTQANTPTRRNIRRRRRAKTRHAMTHRTHAGEHASRHKHTPRQHGEDLASADAAKGPQTRPHNEPTETHAQTRAAKHTHAANKPTRSPDRATSDKVRPLAYAYSECNE